MSGIENLNDLLDEPIKEEKPEKSTKEKKVDDNKLIIGLNDKGKELFIPEKSRFLNTLVLGTKGTGKTTSVLPMFVEQDLKRKNAGVTIICSTKEMSYNLYSLAKKYKRKIHFIKPSVNNEVTNKFLWMKDYNYDYINENIINYKEAIKKKEVVIIDMELLKYKNDALKAVAMLLLQLRLDIQETDITQRCHHFLYVDDAYNYLKFLEDLLVFSDNYNLGITLFMQSRNQFITKNKDFTSLISNNIRNTMLLNNITIEDYNYYKDKFFEKTNPSEFFNREFNSMLYETIDAMGVRRVGINKFKKLLIGDWDELEAKSKKVRASLLKEKRKQRELELKDKYLKSIETNSKVDNENTKNKKENKPTIVEQKNEPILTKEPKPVDLTLIESLTLQPTEHQTNNKIKPRDFNIKKDKNKNKPKPNFEPPKTNYDIDLEHKTKPTIDLMKDISDLGSIKIHHSDENKPQTDKSTKEGLKNNNKENPNDDINQNTKNDNIIKDKYVDKKEKNAENNLNKKEKVIENPLELQKKKEEEALKIQKKIEQKIQDQILNEEKERKRLVATRIFNNYNENIDYCDEVFDFKYE